MQTLVSPVIRLTVAATGFGMFGSAIAQVPISDAPAFNAERLGSLPRDEWITNGGTLSNQRYSPLTRINRDNVANLRAEWRTGMGSGASPGNSGQAQILVYDGVLYVINGDNEIFAIGVDTGDILWKYSANTDPRAGNPFGRSNRGVALGEGRVYAGFLDATVAAIDQQTGEEVWRVPVAPWQEGYSITGAPLYYDGLVISGVSGGVMGRRGRVTAFDADDGSVEWVFYTVRGPGDFGFDTWPADSNAWEHGGEGGGASLRDGLTVETTVAVTSTGRNNMPSFGEAYSVDELYDVATFIVERLAAE